MARGAVRREGSLETAAGGVHLPLTPRAAVPQAAAQPPAREPPAPAAGWGVGRGAGLITWRGAGRGGAGARARLFKGARAEPGEVPRLQAQARLTAETRGAPARRSSGTQHAPLGLAGAGRLALAR